MNKNLTKISSLLTAVAIVMVIFYTAVILVSFNILTPQLYFFIAWSASAIVVTLCLWMAVEIFSRAHAPIKEPDLFDALGLTPIRAVELVEKGANPNAIDKYGKAPLHYASEHGRIELVKTLIGKDANVNVAGRGGCTPLHHAALYGHTQEALALIANGADVNATTNNDNTALTIAVEEGHTRLAEVLIEKGADVNMANKNGYTPLHKAIQRGHMEIASLLIENGADVNMANKTRHTPLTLAVHYNYIPLVEQLLQAGGHRALPMYPGLGNHDMCKILLENEVRLVPRGRDAFHAAFQTYEWWSQDHTAILNNEVPEIQDHTLELHSLLKLAILCGNLEATKALIENADTNIIKACAFIAAHAGQKDIVAHILTIPPKPTEIVNSQGQTLLHLAAATGQADLLKILVEYPSEPPSNCQHVTNRENTRQPI